ncbi:MAG: hypothetical protein MRECE_8c025 [Mycoplasmataceae bacterium CE_OT135]|nr:MAG: hypothetical protein MRECE_8c025 [Mycoplasmataceae bacterium CE_OT135]
MAGRLFFFRPWYHWASASYSVWLWGNCHQVQEQQKKVVEIT